MDLMSGMFRGVCVDNRDPKKLGRIRVQVPQILGVAASGWAFPAWSFAETKIWPQDRLPQTGQGVWVMFDSTSPDKMIWMAAFGPLDLINQPEFVEAPDYRGTLTMTMTGTPTWNMLVTFNGVLGSDLGGVPNPNPVVQITGRQVDKDWQLLGTADPNPVTGAWLLEHRVLLTGAVEYRAVFEGVGVYGPTSSEVIAVTTPVVTFPTTLTLAMTDPAPALNKKVTFSGKLTTGGSPPVEYVVPKPNAVVTLLAKAAGGSYAPVATGAVDGITGDWSADYTIALAGSVQYQATFAGLDVFLPSQSNVIVVSTSVGTTVSTPVVPALTYGSSFNVSGTVKVAGTGAAVTAGTAELWGRWTTGGTTTWQKSVSVAVTAGTYSLTQPAVNGLGPTEWQVRYTGSAAFDAANSAVVGSTVSLPGMGALTKGALTHSTVAFSWAAVSGATGYEVLIWNNNAWILKAALSSATLSHTVSGLNLDTQYLWSVRPKALDNGGAVVYGTASPSISNKTGHPKVTDSGTTGWITIAIWADDSYRNDGNGWDYVSDMRQGYASSAYGGEGYTGAAIYKGSTVRDAVIAACGNSTRHANGTCVAAEIKMTRLTGVGNYNSGVTMSFYRSTTTGSNPGGKPDRLGTAVNRTAAVLSDGATWYDIGTAHGQSIGDGAVNSIVIYRNNSSDYAAFHAYDLRLKWSWNYDSVAYAAPVWL